MPRPLPYKGLSVDRLVDLINETNGTTAVYGVDFTLGEPTPYVSGGEYNTQIRSTPVDTAFRTQTLNYRRLNLAILSALEDSIPPVSIDSLPFTIHEILPQLNEALGLDLLPTEVENTVYTNLAERYSLKILNDTSSHVWLRSAYSFRADLELNLENIRVTSDRRIRYTVDGQVRRVDPGTLDPTPPEPDPEDGVFIGELEFEAMGEMSPGSFVFTSNGNTIPNLPELFMLTIRITPDTEPNPDQRLVVAGLNPMVDGDYTGIGTTPSNLNYRAVFENGQVLDSFAPQPVNIMRTQIGGNIVEGIDLDTPIKLKLYTVTREPANVLDEAEFVLQDNSYEQRLISEGQGNEVLNVRSLVFMDNGLYNGNTNTILNPNTVTSLGTSQLMNIEVYENHTIKSGFESTTYMIRLDFTQANGGVYPTNVRCYVNDFLLADSSGSYGYMASFMHFAVQPGTEVERVAKDILDNGKIKVRLETF